MSEIYNEIVNNRGGLERLVARIPGFKGYQDKQARRMADRMLRDYVAGLVDERIRHLVRVENLILDNVGIEFMTKTRAVKGKLQTLSDKINSAAPGYSGMWAQMKIGAEQMEQLYSFDEAQVRYVERLDLPLEALEKAAFDREGIEEAIFELSKMADDALAAYELRDDLLTGFANS
jgi:hypothetical protein